jgi:Leucine-rich repeat (LRR) protein
MSSTSTPNGRVSTDLLLEYSGEDAVEDVREIVLRDMALTSTKGIDACVKIQILSLSHNALQALDFATKMRFLTELNVNHNRITEITGLSQCPLLERFYAAANQITDIAPLAVRAFPCFVFRVLCVC